MKRWRALVFPAALLALLEAWARTAGRGRVRRLSLSIRPGPGDITTTRSARKIASSMAWVTKTTVSFVRCQMSSNSS